MAEAIITSTSHQQGKTTDIPKARRKVTMETPTTHLHLMLVGNLLHQAAADLLVGFLHLPWEHTYLTAKDRHPHLATHNLHMAMVHDLSAAHLVIPDLMIGIEVMNSTEGEVIHTEAGTHIGVVIRTEVVIHIVGAVELRVLSQLYAQVIDPKRPDGVIARIV
jgi:hypothetical protein